MRPLFVLAAVALLAANLIPAADSRGVVRSQLSNTLDPLTWQYSSALQATLDAFAKGVGLFGDGRFAAALAAVPDDSAAATAVGDYMMYYRARAYQELNQGKESLELFRRLQSRFPESPYLQDAILGEARALLLLHDSASALAALDKEKAGQSAECSLLRAQAFEEAGRRAEAIQLYVRIYAEYVDSRQAAAAERRLKALSPAFAARPEFRDLLLRRGENLIRAGRNQESRALLLKLEAARPSGLQRQRLSLLLGDANTNLKRLPEALRFLKRVDDPTLAAQASYLMGACYRGLRNEAAFLETRDRAMQLHPQSPFTERLLYSVATYYDVDNQTGPAREAYLAIVRGFPKGEYIERALWKVALYAYVDKRYDEALRGFWQCLLADPSPEAASAPAYWMGRCCERLGDSRKAVYFFDRAQALANNSYYGQRAQEALAGLNPAEGAPPRGIAEFDFEQVSRRLNAIQSGPVSLPEATGSVALIIERARQLAAAGLYDLASFELNRGGARSNDKALYYGLSRLYVSRENFFGSISTMRRAYPNYVDLPPSSLPEQFWELLFPVRHFNIVSRQAAKNDLDPDLVLALIRQESSFQASARSRANARGLMQVLPTTGRALARQAGISRYNVSKLYQPETNIALGTRYLASLVQRYGGRLELALAAYNAGDSRVDRWLQQFGDADMAEFVERIPFSETRGYVKQVLTNKAHYHLRTVAGSGSALIPGKN